MKAVPKFLIYSLTAIAITFWAMASFAESKENTREDASRVISNIKDLGQRLDGILKTQVTYGDAKMAPELETLQLEAQSIIENKSASGKSLYGRDLKEVSQDVRTVEKRISELESAK